MYLRNMNWDFLCLGKNVISDNYVLLFIINKFWRGKVKDIFFF